MVLKVSFDYSFPYTDSEWGSEYSDSIRAYFRYENEEDAYDLVSAEKLYFFEEFFDKFPQDKIDFLEKARKIIELNRQGENNGICSESNRSAEN